MSELTDEIVEAIENKEPTRYPRKWETVTPTTERLKIPHGWLIRTNSFIKTKTVNAYNPSVSNAVSIAMVIYNDLDHEWVLEDE